MVTTIGIGDRIGFTKAIFARAGHLSTPERIVIADNAVRSDNDGFVIAICRGCADNAARQCAEKDACNDLVTIAGVAVITATIAPPVSPAISPTVAAPIASTGAVIIVAVNIVADHPACDTADQRADNGVLGLLVAICKGCPGECKGSKC